jgi:hypothetical protein
LEGIISIWPKAILLLHYFSKATALLIEAIKAARFNYPTCIHDQNAIGFANRTESVCNHQGAAGLRYRL